MTFTYDFAMAHPPDFAKAMPGTAENLMTAHIIRFFYNFLKRLTPAGVTLPGVFVENVGFLLLFFKSGSPGHTI